MLRVTQQLGILLIADKNNNKREAWAVLGLSRVVNHNYTNRIDTDIILSFPEEVPPIPRWDNKQRNWEAVRVYIA